tara:strand:- start:138 stop:428 length:291 start_codon:yes stop_codon:yes gene_type:complete
MKKKILTKRIEKKKHSVISLWDKTSKLAQDEGKIPIVALCQKHRKGFWFIIKDDDLDKVHKIMEEDNAKSRKEKVSVYEEGQEGIQEVCEKKEKES